MFARIRSSRSANLFVEILMIVVGINIALWFEGLSDDLQDAETERIYLQGLSDDLRIDLNQLDEIIAGNQAKIDQLGELIPALGDLADAPDEEQAQAMYTPSSYWFFEPATATYTSMRESGDFRLLSDAEIKKSLLSLMRQYDLIEVLQQNFIQALDDEYVPLMMARFDLVQRRITDPTLVDNQVFRNFFPYTLQDTKTRVWALGNAREQANELVNAIEAQLND